MGKVGFVATDGWLTRWKRRSNVVFKQDQREDDGDYFSSWIDTELPKIIDEYSPENVYTAVETGLFYRALPEHRFLFADESEKEEYRSLKEYVTVLCCVNMSGWKEKLAVIGQSKDRKNLKDVKKLPVDYYSNKNGWMTTEVAPEVGPRVGAKRCPVGRQLHPALCSCPVDPRPDDFPAKHDLCHSRSKNH